MDKYEAMETTLTRALHHVFTHTWLYRRHESKPGEIVESMSEDVRAKLRELKSDDLKNPKKEHIVESYNPEKDTLNTLKNEFDLKIMKSKKTHSPYASNVLFIR